MRTLVEFQNNTDKLDDCVFISKKTASAVGRFLIKKLSLARYYIEPYQYGTTQGYVVRLENRRGDLKGYASSSDYRDMREVEANPDPVSWGKVLKALTNPVTMA